MVEPKWDIKLTAEAVELLRDKYGLDTVQFRHIRREMQNRQGRGEDEFATAAIRTEPRLRAIATVLAEHQLKDGPDRGRYTVTANDFARIAALEKQYEEQDRLAQKPQRKKGDELMEPTFLTATPKRPGRGEPAEKAAMAEVRPRKEETQGATLDPKTLALLRKAGVDTSFVKEYLDVLALNGTPEYAAADERFRKRLAQDAWAQEVFGVLGKSLDVVNANDKGRMVFGITPAGRREMTAAMARSDEEFKAAERARVERKGRKAEEPQVAAAERRAVEQPDGSTAGRGKREEAPAATEELPVPATLDPATLRFLRAQKMGDLADMYQNMLSYNGTEKYPAIQAAVEQTSTGVAGDVFRIIEGGLTMVRQDKRGMVFALTPEARQRIRDRITEETTAAQAVATKKQQVEEAQQGSTAEDLAMLKGAVSMFTFTKMPEVTVYDRTRLVGFEATLPLQNGGTLKVTIRGPESAGDILDTLTGSRKDPLTAESASRQLTTLLEGERINGGKTYIARIEYVNAGGNASVLLDNEERIERDRDTGLRRVRPNGISMADTEPRTNQLTYAQAMNRILERAKPKPGGSRMAEM